MLVTGTRCRRFRDNGSDTRAHFKEAFLDQVLDDFVCRVRVDFQVGRKSAYRREGLTGKELSADECFCRRVDDLIENRFTGPECEL